MPSLSSWGCVLKGYFERGILERAKLHLKGIEDFNLEHCLEGPGLAWQDLTHVQVKQRVASLLHSRMGLHS